MRPEKRDDSEVGFQGNNASSGRIALLPGACWAHRASNMAILDASFCSVLYTVSELRRACFQQERVAEAVPPPGALFHARALAFPPCAPKSHVCPLPHLGFSN